MSDRRENSVLFSLRELRKIEQDRVSQEELDRRRRVEEAEQARLAAEQKARDEAEARLRAERDAEQARYDAVEREKREEQLRLDEAERRHRIEAQQKVEEHRLRLEMEAKVAIEHKKKPWGLIAAAGALLVVVIGLGVFVYIQKQNAEAERIATEQRFKALQDESESADKKNQESLAELQRLSDQKDKLLADMSKEKDIAKLQQIERDIKRNQALREAEVQKQKAAAEEQRRIRKKMEDERRKGNCPPSDALCGAQ